MWARLRELQAAAFPGLPRAALLAELVRAQLRCGCWRAARLHLAGRGSSPLAPADAEALVVAAGREYFYAASSLDAPEVVQVGNREPWCAQGLTLKPTQSMACHIMLVRMQGASTLCGSSQDAPEAAQVQI